MQKLMAVIVSMCLFSTVLAQNRAPLKPVQTIVLPQVDGRIDHFSIDVQGQRAFLAALTDNSIQIVALQPGRLIQRLPGYAKPQGVRFVADLNKLFVTTGATGALQTLDGTTLEQRRTDRVAPDADAIGYDPQSKYLYVGAGEADAGNLTVFSAVTGARIAAVATDAHAGGSVVDTRDGRVFVLVPDKAEVLVLDRQNRAQLAKWTVPGIRKNVAVDLDENNHRLFLGVRSPPTIVVLDSRSGAVIASTPTVGTLDGLSFDPQMRRIYTSGGEGFLDVTQQIDPDHYERIARIATGPNARTSLFVPEWRRVYVAVPRDQDRSAELQVFEAVP